MAFSTHDLLAINTCTDSNTQRKSFFRIRTVYNPQRTVYKLLTDIFTHPRMAKGPIWSVGYNPNQTVYGPDATECKHVVNPLHGSCSKCTCYVYKMFSNSLYNAVHIITKRCHCPVMPKYTLCGNHLFSFNVLNKSSIGSWNHICESLKLV